MCRFLLCISVFFCLSGCVEKTTVVDLPDAENLHFTANQRLFASGGGGLWEIHKTTAGWSKTPVIRNDCNFNGITSLQQWLFVVCSRVNMEHELYAVSLTDLSYQVITPLTDFFIPNGLTTLPDNASLLLADENFFQPSGAAKVTLDLSGAWPQVSGIQRQWLNESHRISRSNGVRRRDQTVYVTDLGKVKRLSLDNEHTPSIATTLFERSTVFDDLYPYCDGVLVTDFFAGQLLYISDEGELLWHSEKQLFRFPSAVQPAQPPLFESDQILITEKGLLGDTHSSFGNRLVVMPREQLGLPGC